MTCRMGGLQTRRYVSPLDTAKKAADFEYIGWVLKLILVDSGYGKAKG